MQRRRRSIARTLTPPRKTLLVCCHPDFGKKSPLCGAFFIGEESADTFGSITKATPPVTLPSRLRTLVRMTDFAAIFRDHWDDVQRFSLYLCGDHAESEDLASEAFLRAWMSTRPVRLATVRAYLFVIVRNLHRDRLRRGARSRPLDRTLPEPRRGPDALAADRDSLRRVLAAMQQLTEPDRALLALAALGSISHDQIAAALDISVSAAKVRIHRARLKLNIALQSNRLRNEP
jgi:RNA polymerase sigma factor (sigma-70 family)